jgi:hypothetical protein
MPDAIAKSARQPHWRTPVVSPGSSARPPGMDTTTSWTGRQRRCRPSITPSTLIACGTERLALTGNRPYSICIVNGLPSGAVEETEAHTAWSLDDGEDWPTQRLTPARITGVVVAGSVVIIAVASTVAWMVLHDRSEPPAAGPAPTSSVQPAPPSTAVAASQSPSAAPPPPRPQPPAPVMLRMDPYGQVHVRTVSGHTVGAMTAGDVQCNVHFTNRLGPICNGMPVSGVGVN